jgi:hypothetical protein
MRIIKVVKKGTPKAKPSNYCPYILEMPVEPPQQ